APILAALVAFAVARYHRESLARQSFDRGEQALAAGDCAAADAQFATAAAQAEAWLGLGGLGRAAMARRGLALEIQAFHHRADPLRFHLLGFGGDREYASRELTRALAPFGVLEHSAWWLRGELGRLDAPLRSRLLAEINDLLFLWVIAAETDRPDDPETTRRALGLCARALAFAEPRAPWDALRGRWLRRQGEREHPPVLPRTVAQETSARACFQWAQLARLQHDRRRMLAWLDRAQFLQPDNYWYQYAFAVNLERDGDVEGALRHYEAAVALRPEAPWAWFNRAHLYAVRRGAWVLALRDLDRAVAAAGERPRDRAQIRVERGQVRQAVGDVVGARADFEAALAADPDGPSGRAARLDRARLDAEAGAADRAWAEYDALVESDPSDPIARLARARLALRQGRAAAAQSDLTGLLTQRPEADPAARADWLACRALARLALGQAALADADAEAAWRLDPGPGRTRLWTRAALAAGRPVDANLLHPDAIAGWPVGGPALAADLRAAIERLRPAASDATAATAASALRARAAMLSALGEHAAAVVAAEQSIARAPTAASYALGAEVRLRAGDRPGALNDVERGLAADRDNPLLLTLRGRLAIEAGDLDAGLRWLDRAVFHGAGGPAHAGRARALWALDRPEPAAAAWSSALAGDPDDPDAFLGRARCLRRLGLWENALADLEQAAQRAPDASWLLARVTLEYLACLPARPDRLPRAVELARRVWPGWSLTGGRPLPGPT
ncbi:MAG TPA: tetratricopeptide repeat protein, partial [Isosphaeraceae bacterium]|nr:tetratricopeptide repeat protein [Isosphaeraceae bacterium]